VCADGGERPPSPGRRSGRVEVEGSLSREVLVRVGSSPDKAGAGQYCQMVRARRTRREGVTRVNQWLNLRNRGSGSNLADVGRAAVRAERTNGEATSGTVIDAGPGGREESLRRTRGDAAGAELDTAPADRDTVNMGTLPCPPYPVCCQQPGGQGHRRLTGAAGGGAAVVVRGRESRPHGKGRQRVRNEGAAMPGGRR
jgi:hypothetical protein